MCSNKKYYIKGVVFNVFYHAARAAGEMKKKNNKRAGFTCALLFEMMIQPASDQRTESLSRSFGSSSGRTAMTLHLSSKKSSLSDFDQHGRPM